MLVIMYIFFVNDDDDDVAIEIIFVSFRSQE
jgi:hypothetical protein